MKKLLTLVAALAVLSLPAAGLADSLMMATTTSTDNTGLLDELAPRFKKDTGVELKWTAVGTGKALQMGRDCNVDILMVHAPPAEKQFVANGHGVDRRQVMYNDFVIIGPPEDPAGIKGEKVTDALKAVKAEDATFVSRGDDSGTNKKELGLWQAAGEPAPDKEDFYVQTGQGMLPTINIAAQKDGYTLTDRGTFIKYAANHDGNPPLDILVEGDPSLFNQYSVITVNPAKCPDVQPELAEKFTEWITSDTIQQEIRNFRLLGKPLFIPNAK